MTTDTVTIENAAQLAKESLYKSVSRMCTWQRAIDTDLEDDYLVDLRLRYFEGSFEILYGDAQYDTDYRGVWGYGCIDITSTIDDIKEAVDDLIEDLLSNAAM